MKQLFFVLSILFSFSLTGQRDSVTTFLRTYQNIDTANISDDNEITTTYRSNAEGTVTSIDTTDMTVSGYINMLIEQAQADSIVYRINRESFYSAYQEASTNYLNNARYLQKLQAVAGNVFELPNVGVRGVAEGGSTGQILSKASGDDFDTEWVIEPLVYIALLTQSGTDAPVATILENTLGGTVVWSVSSPGSYIGTLMGAFTTGKTIIYPDYTVGYYIDGYGRIVGGSNSEDDVYIEYQNGVHWSDDGITNVLVEIRVYP